MRAVLAVRPGGVEVLELRELPDPAPREGEVLVRLKAAGVNPVDAKSRKNGTRLGGASPAVLGCEGAGVIVGRGPGVVDLREGEEVYFCYGGLGGAPGCYAELAAVPASSVARKPRNLSFREAAAAPLVLITAWEALHDRLRIAAGSRLLVLGGTGGVGHVAIQLARILGARVAATVGSEEKADYALRLGAERAIRYRRDDLLAAAMEWSQAQGVDAVLDTVGGALLARSFEALRVYGAVASILPPAETLPVGALFAKNATFGLELMLSPQLFGLPAELARQRGILDRAARLFEAGSLSLRIAEAFPLERAGEAHLRIETAGTMGKIVLDIPEAG